MSMSTHVLDTSRGRPATGVAVALRLWSAGAWQERVAGVTNEDGRLKLLERADLVVGTYQLTFEIGRYFLAQGVEAFYPKAVIEFVVTEPNQHYHVPLLLSPFGYSTYRGS